MQNSTDQTNPAQKILLAAYDCLSTRGYANVTMRNIADEADVALSQLTYYFKNKETLFTEVINRMASQYIREIETRMGAAADLNEKIVSLSQFFKEMLRDKPKLLKLFIDFTAQALWIPSFREQVDSLFVSLVVSLIMIGIITYTSVLERTTEIGVLRALGARKKDITRVFDAETFILGICSGLLGVSIAWILTAPINIIFFNLTELNGVANLQTQHAALLVVISTVLTVLGGHIPARMASRKDAVEALRSE